MTEELKLERTGFGDMRRIVRGRTAVATAQQFSNGKWGAYSTTDSMRLTILTFNTPNAVLRWVKERHRQGADFTAINQDG